MVLLTGLIKFLNNGYLIQKSRLNQYRGPIKLQDEMRGMGRCFGYGSRSNTR